jgi:hypothetical protein
MRFIMFARIIISTVTHNTRRNWEFCVAKVFTFHVAIEKSPRSLEIHFWSINSIGASWKQRS